MTMTTRSLLPLAKKSHREQAWLAKPSTRLARGELAECPRMEGVPVPVYQALVRAVQRAVGINWENNDTRCRPLVLDVHNIGAKERQIRKSATGALAPDTYYLAYYPLDVPTGMRVMQTLYVLYGEQQSELVLALCNPDGMLRDCPTPDEQQRAGATVARHVAGCPTGATGRWVYCPNDIDDLLAEFSVHSLYLQQCHVDLDCIYSDGVDADDAGVVDSLV